MNYQSLVYDFVVRTKANLAAIEDIARRESYAPTDSASVHREKSVYEVTQLINSLLGLIFLPQQNYFDEIPSTSSSDLEKDGWFRPLMNGELPEDLKNLNDLMRYVRNSVAHFNIKFFADSAGQINGLKIWNVNRAKKVNWTAQLSLTDLRLLLEKFTDLILDVQK